MDKQSIDEKLQELISQISGLPKDQQEKLKLLAEGTQRRQKQIQDDIQEAKDSLDDMTLQCKYLVFDLEATKREQDDLKSRTIGKDDDHRTGIGGK